LLEYLYVPSAAFSGEDILLALEDKFKTENAPAIAVKMMKFDCSGLALTVRIVHILVNATISDLFYA
jgi:hypothetical protein